MNSPLAKVEFVSRMVDSLSRPQQVDIGSETWITASPDWVEYFGSRSRSITAQRLSHWR